MTDVVRDYLKQTEACRKHVFEGSDKHLLQVSEKDEFRPKMESFDNLIELKTKNFTQQAALLTMLHITRQQREMAILEKMSNTEEARKELKKSWTDYRIKPAEKQKKRVLMAHTHFKEVANLQESVIHPLNYVACYEQFSLAPRKRIKTKTKESSVPFKSLKECMSRASSQAYYMNKADLVDLISKDDRLKKKVGSKYASMTKEAICNILFDE